jgi:hypothetical protein
MRIRIVACVLVALFVALSLLASIYYRATRRGLETLESTCEAISDWARRQPLPVGSHIRCNVPASIPVPAGSEVNLVVEPSGDVEVLLKTHVGWKRNYEGVLYSTRLLRPAEIESDSSGPDQLNIRGIDANPPMIRERITPTFFRVYFDLG